MRSLFRLCLLIAAFLGGCHVQNWVAIDHCLDRGGQWVKATGQIPGGVCTGVRAG